MKDNECVEFLQWALPQLHLSWPGFRKVRRQVCKRVQRRLSGLGLANISTYQYYLEQHADEWKLLDSLCRITISRFYRNKKVFMLLEEEILPQLAQQALAAGEHSLKIWSAGCCGGEEPYSIVLLWDFALSAGLPGLDIQILATDVDSNMLLRAKQACFSYPSVKDLPESWRDVAFDKRGDLFCLHQEFKRKVEFLQQDVRTRIPNGPFSLILCRNLVFMYFDLELQSQITEKMWERVLPGGVLIMGDREKLPDDVKGFRGRNSRLGIYEKTVEMADIQEKN